MAVAGCAQRDVRTSYLEQPLGNGKQVEFSAETCYAAGQLAESQHNMAGAMADYQRALKAKGNSTPALYRIGVLYTEQRDYSRAIDAWTQYLAATHDSAQGYANLGYCQELAGQPDQAKASFEKGLAKEANNPSCRVNYGLLLAREGKIREAETQFKGILTEAQMHYDLGAVYEQQQRIGQARAQYMAALKLDPALTAAKARLDQLQMSASVK